MSFRFYGRNDRIMCAKDKMYGSLGIAIKKIWAIFTGKGLVAIKNMVNKQIPQIRFYGDCEQSTEPTLDNPVDVQSVGILGSEEQSLPYGYVQADWLIFDGSSYLNTGILTNQSLKVECKFKPINASKTQAIFGTRSNNVSDGLCAYIASSSSMFFSFGGATSGIILTKPLNNTNVSTIEISNDGVFLNGEKQPFNTIGTFYKFYSMFLGTWYSNDDSGSSLGGADSRMFNGNVYSFKVWESDTLVSDMIPCTRMSDNVCGMYDRIRDIFLVNANTGILKVGCEKEAYKVPVKVRGKNLIDASKFVLGYHLQTSDKYNYGMPTVYYNNSRGTILEKIYLYGHDSIIITLPQIGANKSVMISLFDYNGVCTLRGTGYKNGSPVDISGAYYMYVCVYTTIISELLDMATLKGFQIEFGKTITECEPYVEQVDSMITVNKPLYKIISTEPKDNTVVKTYADYIDVVNKKVKRNCDFAYATDSTKLNCWIRDANYTFRISCNILGIKWSDFTASRRFIYCSRGIAELSKNLPNTGICFLYSNQIFFYMNEEYMVDANTIMEWFTNNTTYFIYPLPVETEEDIEIPELVYSIPKGTMIIESTKNVYMEVECYVSET